MSNIILTLAVYVVLLIKSSDSLQCYDCTSSLGQNSLCEKDISGSTVSSSTCYTGHCMTYVINDFVKRRCGSPLECVSMAYSPRYVSCESCQTDFCNRNAVTGDGGTTIAPQICLFLMSVVLTKCFLL